MAMKTRAQLLQEIRDEQLLWRDLVAEVGPGRMNEPGPMGQWTFKDLVSHLFGWRDRSLSRLEAAAADLPDPAAPWPSDLKDDDPINDWIRERDRKLSLDQVLANYDRSFDRLAAVIAAFSNDALMTPGHFKFFGDASLVDAQFFGHLHGEHEPSIREWLRTRG